MPLTSADRDARLHHPEQRPRRDRRDIQGLRALAVTVVILDHLVGWPQGGFIGVDVFLVISGFLITDLLIREQARTGSISFLGFYKRRVKRIVPAATLVILATVTASWFVFSASRWRSTVGDALWALLFSGNWRFASSSTDYFDQGAPDSPLQHYWSLGVEEQFYFVWPWLLLAAVLLLRRRPTLVRPVAGLLIGILTVASFGWASWESRHSPSVAYFSTLSRAWELGLGACLAAAAPLLLRIPDVLRPALGWAGLAGITASLWLIAPGTTFPAPGAVLPVAAAGLVIAAGTRESGQQSLFPLTNPISRYVGDISYSLYLWHFPIIVIGTALWQGTPAVRAGLGLTVVVTASYAYHLFENPLRRTTWGSRPRLTRTWTKTAASAALVLAVAATALTARGPGVSGGINVSPPVSGDLSRRTPELDDLHQQFREALAAPSWPALEPSLDEAIAGLQAPPDITECGLSKQVDVSGCTWGDPGADRLAVTVGNSVSLTYTGALRSAFEDHPEWAVAAFGMFGCPFGDFADAPADQLADLPDGCGERPEDAVAAINELEPDVVFVGGVSSNAPSLLTELPAATRVVVMPPPPIDKDVRECYTRTSVPEDCVSRVPEGWGVWERDIAQAASATYFDTTPWFCYEGYCPSFAGSLPVKMDDVHMTPEFARRIGPVVWETLRAADVVSPS